MCVCVCVCVCVCARARACVRACVVVGMFEQWSVLIVNVHNMSSVIVPDVVN